MCILPWKLRYSVPAAAILNIQAVLSMNADEEYSVLLQDIARGGIVNNPTTALKISEILIQDIYGEDELLIQRPLKIEDQGDRWLVLGRPDATKETEGCGPVRVIISKRDGRIIDVIKSAPLKPASELRDIIRKKRPLDD